MTSHECTPSTATPAEATEPNSVDMIDEATAPPALKAEAAPEAPGEQETAEGVEDVSSAPVVRRVDRLQVVLTLAVIVLVVAAIVILVVSISRHGPSSGLPGRDLRSIMWRTSS